MYEEQFMARAIALSRRALEEPGSEPFGAVVVKDGAIVGEGLNRMWARLDPTSHGEVEAIRDACRRLGTLDLSGAAVYTSCEPCPMCVAAMIVSGIGSLYYGASLGQSGSILAALAARRRRPFTIEAMRAEVGLPVEGRRMPAAQKRDGEAVAVLEAWVAQRLRT
jgi:tRNA(Arg) A34 adenosine deaminase TadA